ncbi:MAG: M42 family metallopeptidase [Verrucomicrobia bacterium]|jgi:tetrahedral aminopeptidase|nr:M42 family metallopeptidase [Verrucomicrobiota bacterium]
MKKTIRNMVEGFGPSGFEDRIRKRIRTEIRGCADKVHVDAMGNLIALRRGTAAKRKTIMVAAHMDEIGLMVSYVDKRGFVRISPLGGVSPIYELGGRVQFENGVVGVIHTEKPKKPSAPPSLETLYVDVGATSKKDCPVSVGDVGVFLQPMVEVGDKLVAKAMDDRMGCAVMIQAMRELKDKALPHDVCFVFTTQEEVGLRGAMTGAYGIQPDLGMALDVTFTGDTPEPNQKIGVSLGGGAAIKIKDSGMITQPWVKNWMIEVAEQGKIPYQREVMVGGATDAAAIQKSRAGVATGCISIPCRYIHSPSEMVSYSDVLACVRLLKALLVKPKFAAT